MSTTDGRWWDEAWSLVEGCSHVSPACDHCWSETATAMRACQSNPAIRARYGGLTDAGRFNGTVRLMERDLDKPLRRKKPTTYAVWNDLFHEDVPAEFINRALAVVALCPQHTFIVLTKRAERMREHFSSQFLAGRVDREKCDLMSRMPDKGRAVDVYLGEEGSGYFENGYLGNLWLGVTAENQNTADARIPHLLATPAAVRFVSCEPLLGAINFRWPEWDDWSPNERRKEQKPPVLRDGKLIAGHINELDGLRMLDWVIAGGETGPNARPMHPEWVRGLRDQCQTAGTPFFFKSWGEFRPTREGIYFEDEKRLGVQMVGLQYDGVQHNACVDMSSRGVSTIPASMIRVTAKRAGAILDGREWRELPEVAG